jgi:hypothetical protein
MGAQFLEHFGNGEQTYYAVTPTDRQVTPARREPNAQDPTTNSRMQHILTQVVAVKLKERDGPSSVTHSQQIASRAIVQALG